MQSNFYLNISYFV